MKYTQLIPLFLTGVGLMFFCCSSGKNAPVQPVCFVGHDTLTIERVKQLVPDSMALGLRTTRAVFEVLFANQMKATLQSARQADSENTRKIVSDFAKQLSRQTTDVWTIEAAWELYYAGKYVVSQTKQMGAMAGFLAHVDSLFSQGVVFPDTAQKRKIIFYKDSLFKNWLLRSLGGPIEQAVPFLLMLPPEISPIVVEFLNPPNTSAGSGAEVQKMIKGLVFDKNATKQEKMQSKNQSVPKENTGNALMYRTKQSITDSIGLHIPNLEALYKKHLKLHPSMQGTVWVTFQISASGKVLSARIKTNTIVEKDFLISLQDYLLAKVRFKPIPENIGTMAFEFPFDFLPEN